MKIKYGDLDLLMQYLHKEAAELVSVEIGNMDSRMSFMFKDLENRDCCVTLFAADHNTTPELTKTMKLYSRLPKVASKKSKESEDE